MMKRVLRWLRRWWGLLGLAIALLLALYIALAPAVARWAAMRTLEGMGLKDVQFEVSGVSPTYAEMRNVTVGPEGRLRVAAAGVTYSPGGIANGRVRTIDLAGAEVLVKVKDGVVDFGPLAGILAVKGSKKKAKLPFDRADLRSSAIVLDWEGQRLRIPVRGWVENLGDGKAKLDAHIEIAGTHLRVAVTGDINTLEGEAVVEGRTADFAGLLAAIPPKVATLPARASGAFAFKVTVSSKKEGIYAKLSAQIEGAALSIPVGGGNGGIEIERVSAEANARLNRSLEVLGWAAEVRAVNLKAKEESIQVTASAEKSAHGQPWGFGVRASGNGWELGGEGSWQRGLPQCAIPPEEWALPCHVHANGAFPEWVRSALSKQGIDVDRTGRFAVEGMVVPRLRRADRGWTWGVEVQDTKATLESREVVIGPGGVVLRGLDVKALIGGGLTADGLQWHILPDTQVTLGSLVAESSGIRLIGAKDGVPVCTAEPGGKGVEFTASFQGGKAGWRAEAPEILLRFGEQHAAFGGGDVTIEGLSGTVPVRAEAGPGGGKAFTLAGGGLGFRSLETIIGGLRERAGPTHLDIDPASKEPLFDLAFASGAAGTLKPELERGTPTKPGDSGVPRPSSDLGVPAGWIVRVAASAKAKGAVDVAVGEGGAVKLGTLRTAVTFTHDSEGKVSVKSASTAEAVEGSLKAPMSAGALTASSTGGDLRFEIAGEGRSGEMSKVPWKLDFAVNTGRAQARVPLSSGDLEVSAAQCGWSGSATVGVEPRRLDTKVGFAGLAIQHAASGVAASDMAGEVPVTLNREAKAAGRFEIGSVLLGKEKLATQGKLSGTVRVADWKADFSAAWPLVAGATLSGAGWVDFGRGTPQGALKAAIPRFQIGEDNQPAKVFPAAKGFDVRGAFALDASLSFLGDRLDPLIRLTAEKADLASQEYDATAQGVDAAITLSSLTPPSTPGNQRIAFKKARMGQLEMQDGLIVFRLEDPHALLVETARAGWAGGRLYTEAFRVDPQAPDIDVAIYGDRLKLGEILALLPNGIAKGEGELYGRLPVHVQRPVPRLNPGFVYATPGTKGWIQIRDTPEVRQYIEPSLKAAVEAAVRAVLKAEPRSSIDQVRADIEKRLIEGLENFEFSIFRTDFVTVKDALMPVVFMVGQGRTGAQQEFKGVTIDFPLDFDKLVIEAIIVKRGVQDALEKGVKK